MSKRSQVKKEDIDKLLNSDLNSDSGMLDRSYLDDFKNLLSFDKEEGVITEPTEVEEEQKEFVPDFQYSEEHKEQTPNTDFEYEPPKEDFDNQQVISINMIEEDVVPMNPFEGTVVHDMEETEDPNREPVEISGMDIFDGPTEPTEVKEEVVEEQEVPTEDVPSEEQTEVEPEVKTEEQVAETHEETTEEIKEDSTEATEEPDSDNLIDEDNQVTEPQVEENKETTEEQEPTSEEVPIEEQTTDVEPEVKTEEQEVQEETHEEPNEEVSDDKVVEPTEETATEEQTVDAETPSDDDYAVDLVFDENGVVVEEIIIPNDGSEETTVKLEEQEVPSEEVPSEEQTEVELEVKVEESTEVVEEPKEETHEETTEEVKEDNTEVTEEPDGDNLIDEDNQVTEPQVEESTEEPKEETKTEEQEVPTEEVVEEPTEETEVKEESTEVVENNEETKDSNSEAKLEAATGDLDDIEIDTTETGAKIINQIDYFSFDFSNVPEEPKEEVSKPQELDIDELGAFSFESVIRPNNEFEVMPNEEDRIVLNKVLETKNKKKDEHELTIEETTNVKKRTRRDITRIYVYSFYALFALIIAGVIYLIIQNKTEFDLTMSDITLDINTSYEAEIIMDQKVQKNTDFTWTSSNPSAVVVTEDGVVTALDKGSAVITVKSKKTRKTKELLVTSKPITVTSLTINQKGRELTVGDEIDLTATVNKDESIIVKLSWYSDEVAVATVSESGKVTAVGPGSVTIYVVHGDSHLTSGVTFTVKDKQSSQPSSSNGNPAKTVAVKGVSVNKKKVNLKVGESENVSAIISPNNATNKNVSWSSSNTDVAKVSNGRITGVKEGTATVTVTTNDGNKKATITVTVTKKGGDKPIAIPADGVKLNKQNLQLNVGDTYQLEATISPKDTTDKSLSWKSQRSDVASVNNGLVTANKAGTTTITVSTSNGKATTCEVEVIDGEVHINDN